MVHLVAIIIFAPTTYCLPQLLSLSYAIAICGLLVLETIRWDCQVLQHFYTTFQDPTKDNAEQGMVLSHLFLILGCALPLWIAQCVTDNSSQQEMREMTAAMSSPSSIIPGWLLSQWGVLCLGVGDAMSALIGKRFGTIQWGRNHRTLEGSAVMWCRMMRWWCWRRCHDSNYLYLMLRHESPEMLAH